MFSNVTSKSFHLTNLNLLYIDNDDKNLDEPIELFKGYFQKILIASNKNDALNCFIKDSIDLIVIDLENPNFDGFEIIEEIKK